MKLRVIKTLKEAKAHNPYEPGLLEIPGQWAQAVVSLIGILDEHRNTGLIVTNVGPGSPAATAGVARGDILLQYDGVPLDQTSTLKRLTGPYIEGGDIARQVVIEAVRGKNEMRFEVAGGRLGITVSAFFRHLIPAQH